MGHNMTASQLYSLDLAATLHGLRAGDFSAVELTEAYLARITATDERLNAYITVTAEQALRQAQQADQQRRQGEDAPLLGVPLAIKDVLATRDVQTTCGSRILQGFVPPYTATAVNKLEAAGMIMLGKTNCDEFAMGSSNENSAYGITHNPWDLERVPGGSSGGSAAAIAADQAVAALGTDTGGSIRQPASLCGVVGLKPSYGRVSRYGVVAYASSLDQVGIFAKRVYDAALLLEVIAGHDPQDSTSLPDPVPAYTADLTAGIKGLRIGLPQEYFIDGMDPAVEAAVRAAVQIGRAHV